MELIRPFAKIGKGDAALAGGKGASLGEMTQAGIPVPPGYVILSDAFERFIEETDLNIEIDAILTTVQTDNVETVEQAVAAAGRIVRRRHPQGQAEQPVALGCAIGIALHLIETVDGQLDGAAVADMGTSDRVHAQGDQVGVAEPDLSQ